MEAERGRLQKTTIKKSPLEKEKAFFRSKADITFLQ
jgi:hypothetical protein